MGYVVVWCILNSTLGVGEMTNLQYRMCQNEYYSDNMSCELCYAADHLYKATQCQQLARNVRKKGLNENCLLVKTDLQKSQIFLTERYSRLALIPKLANCAPWLKLLQIHLHCTQLALLFFILVICSRNVNHAKVVFTTQCLSGQCKTGSGVFWPLFSLSIAF